MENTIEKVEYVKEFQICRKCGGRTVVGNRKWGYSKPCPECEQTGEIEVLAPKQKK
jgi:ribosomal protein L40E